MGSHVARATKDFMVREIGLIKLNISMVGGVFLLGAWTLAMKGQDKTATVSASS